MTYFHWGSGDNGWERRFLTFWPQPWIKSTKSSFVSIAVDLLVFCSLVFWTATGNKSERGHGTEAHFNWIEKKTKMRLSEVSAACQCPHRISSFSLSSCSMILGISKSNLFKVFHSDNITFVTFWEEVHLMFLHHLSGSDHRLLLV